MYNYPMDPMQPEHRIPKSEAQRDNYRSLSERGGSEPCVVTPLDGLYRPNAIGYDPMGCCRESYFQDDGNAEERYAGDGRSRIMGNGSFSWIPDL